jgi:hypothetical protein
MITPDQPKPTGSKYASMSPEQREARALELASTDLTPETSQEFIEIVLGPGFSFADDAEDVNDHA